MSTTFDLATRQRLFEEYWARKDQKSSGFHTICLARVADIDWDNPPSSRCWKGKADRLPEPEPGYEWYYTEDTMPLSGMGFFVQMNVDERIIGDSTGHFIC